jgi:hypothetical protein
MGDRWGIPLDLTGQSFSLALTDPLAGSLLLDIDGPAGGCTVTGPAEGTITIEVPESLMEIEPGLIRAVLTAQAGTERVWQGAWGWPVVTPATPVGLGPSGVVRIVPAVPVNPAGDLPVTLIIEEVLP